MSKGTGNTPLLRIRNTRMSLTLLFSFFVFVILLSAIIISAGIVFLIEFIMGGETMLDTWLVLVLMMVASALIGYVLVFLLSKFPLSPINRLINGLNRLAAGDFKARLSFKGVFYNNSTFDEISESFNRLATELESTEMLRGDFVNNFSHEFKTPIVSIAGFARLLLREDLGEDERQQYLEVIEHESRRLATMATSVLNLTKLENQNILSNIREFNLSEEIRSAILVLEPKWSAKGIVLDMDLDEHIIEGDEELLEEVWINLIDNAVKFSPDGGRVEISVADQGDSLEIRVSNEGEEIPEEKRTRLFAKFYQADEAHATQGSGIGLAIVSRVLELHHAKVTVLCDYGRIIFVVTLPKVQKIA